jgi:hypothetical protein
MNTSAVGAVDSAAMRRISSSIRCCSAGDVSADPTVPGPRLAGPRGRRFARHVRPEVAATARPVAATSIESVR